MVKHKALNLVDVGSSPMVEITSYTVIMNESYTKSQLDNILLTRPLGATRCWSSLHDHIYKIPAHYCIMTRPLGATLIEVFISNYKSQVAASMTTRHLGLHIWSIQSLLVTKMNNMDFFKVAAIIWKQVLSHHFVLLKTWGLQVIWI